MNSLSDQAKEKESTHNEDQYPMIWFLDLQENMTLTTPIRVNSSVHVFEKSKDNVVKFAQSLGESFLLIISRNGLNEKKLLEDLGALENTYERSLTHFEKASVLKEISVERSDENTDDFGMYVFYTRGDFENENIEETMRKYDVPEVAKVFREEYIFWERKQKGLEKADAVFEDSMQGLEDPFQEEDLMKCKEFCISCLKELVKQRNHEKEKVICYVNLGESCQKLEEYQKALEYHGKALEILESIYGEEHPSVAKLYNYISNVYYCTEQFEKTLVCDLKVLNIRKFLCGEAYWGVASAYYNLGLDFYSLKDYQKSIENHLKALHIYKTINGERHVFTSFVYQGIHDIYWTLGDFTKAIQFNLKALNISKFASRKSSNQNLRNQIARVKFDLEEHQKKRELEKKNLDLSLEIKYIVRE